MQPFAENQPTKQLYRAKVLVVDDEPPILRMLQRDLRLLGFDPITASDPSVGLAMLEVRRFDAVLSDLQLPMPSGKVFATSAAMAAPYTPIVVLTGEDSLRNIHKLLEGVAINGLLPKPYTKDLLARNLERAIAVGRNETADPENKARTLADGLVRALALRDIETENHSRRVSAWARILGREVGLANDELLQCELGALLHDVGKIGVPDAILRKPGKLTPEEWEEMRKHPNYGREMLAGIDELRGASEVVSSHHERYEGGGYPRGLVGKVIPMGARIFSIVDTYDAMTSDRVYRKALPHEAAVAEIQRLAGVQYDPDVVAAFMRINQDEWRLVRERFQDPPLE